MKINLPKILLSLMMLFSTEAFSDDYKEYENNYYALYLGVTPIHEMLDYLGPPIKITSNNDKIAYAYEDLFVFARKSTGKITRISICDEDYEDKNGMRVGYAESYLREAIKIDETRTDSVGRQYAMDLANGIAYWIVDDRIKKIVLSYRIDL